MRPVFDPVLKYILYEVPNNETNVRVKKSTGRWDILLQQISILAAFPHRNFTWLYEVCKTTQSLIWKSWYEADMNFYSKKIWFSSTYDLHFLYISSIKLPNKAILWTKPCQLYFSQNGGKRRISIDIKDFWEVLHNRTEILAYSCMACSGHYFESFIKSLSSYISYYHRDIFIKTGHLKFAKLPPHELKVNLRK